MCFAWVLHSAGWGLAAVGLAGIATLCFMVGVAGLTNTEASLRIIAGDAVEFLSDMVAGTAALMKLDLALPAATMSVLAMFSDMLVIGACILAIDADSGCGDG